MSFLLIIEHIVFVIAVAVPVLFILAWIEASPKIYPELSWTSFFPLISIFTLPSLIIYIAWASSPALKIVYPGLNIKILIVVERANFCLFVKQENKGTFYIVYEFLNCSYILIFFRVFLKIKGFSTRNSHYFEVDRMEAVLGERNNKANYPKVSPFPRDLTTFPSIYVSTVPE